MLQTRRPALSGNALKGIAILAMTLDHLTWTLWPGYSTAWWVLLLHLFGRVTAPIMWFFVVEGYHYTHDVKKYAVRLFALAFISHFAYDFCFGIPFLPLSTGPFNQTGVVWSLAWGLMLLVIHDELDIPAGDVRVKVGGGHAGHNGLRSIIDKMGSRDFSRIRTGIGNPPGKMAVADYVLKQLRAREAEDFQDTCARAADAAGLAIVHGVIYARDHVNGAASANGKH